MVKYSNNKETVFGKLDANLVKLIGVKKLEPMLYIYAWAAKDNNPDDAVDYLGSDFAKAGLIVPDRENLQHLLDLARSLSVEEVKEWYRINDILWRDQYN